MTRDDQWMGRYGVGRRLLVELEHVQHNIGAESLLRLVIVGLEHEVAALVEVDAVRRLYALRHHHGDAVLELVAAPRLPGRLDAQRGPPAIRPVTASS